MAHATNPRHPRLGPKGVTVKPREQLERYYKDEADLVEVIASIIEELEILKARIDFIEDRDISDFIE